jgi:hypothetical protein
MAGSCECGNEHWGSINAGISWVAEYLLASQEGICYVELSLRTAFDIKSGAL